MSDRSTTKKRRKKVCSSTETEIRDEGECSQGSVLSWLAVFGDSSLALIFSFVLLLVAVFVALLLDETDFGGNVAIAAHESLGQVPKSDAPHIFVAQPGVVASEILSAFEKDGVVAVRGLLTHEQLKRLDIASSTLVHDQRTNIQRKSRKRSSTQFHTVIVGPSFLEPPSSDESTQTMGSRSAFRDVALFSAIPKFAAHFLGLEEKNNQTMRMLRDIFLVKDDDPYICGWHVDDTGFWPATAASPGVNAWIAIDDIPIHVGGGFALAVGSHVAPWRNEAHIVTGSTMTLPPGGFRDAADMFANRTGSGTCNLKTAAPHLNKLMEDASRIYEVRRGDVIFHDRWLFHRTVPFLRKNDDAAGATSPLYRRYSVRYSPGSAEIPRGYGIELSVLWNHENGGRTADAVADLDGPWYPRCWPSTSSLEMAQLNDLIINKLPVAVEVQKMRKKEMQPYLLEKSKKQRRQTDATEHVY